jgi:antitoxin component YwqK of YwqJK toxin-antitoxin module
MKSIVTLLTICLAFAAQSQILKKTYHDYQKTKPHEVYYVNSQGQYNGSYTKYDYEGAKLFEGTFVNGVGNGPVKEYYTRNGVSKLKWFGNYKNGEKHGQCITYTYVKYGQSYYNIIQSMMFNDKEVDIFNTGVQTKVNEEVYDNGKLTKEIIYHLTGKIAISRNYVNTMCTGEYLAYNSKNNLIIKGNIGEKGKMIGEWTIPRKEDGTSPDKNNTEECTYTQKIKFDKNGLLDTNFMSKSYYLSGKLKDSVRVVSFEYPSGYDWNGIWFLCGKNKQLKGSYRSFHETGKTKSEGQFKIENALSVKTGIWKNYDANGILINEVNEDEIREKATESKKEAERVEKERVEKKRVEMEEKLTKETKDKAELTALNQKADSCINLEQNLFHTYSISHKNTNPISLDDEFQSIHESFEYKISELKSQISKDNLIGSDKKKQLYSEMIDLGTRHIKTNQKMIDFKNTKISIWEQQKYNIGTGKVYELKASLNRVQKVEDKIRIFENYQLEPK